MKTSKVERAFDDAVRRLQGIIDRHYLNLTEQGQLFDRLVAFFADDAGRLTTAAHEPEVRWDEV